MGRIPWTAIFPFLLLHSRAAPSKSTDGAAPSEVMMRRMLLALSLARDGGLNLSVLYVFSLLVAATPAVLGVYFMLALSTGFPDVGGRALWVCIVKDFGAIFTLRMLCTSYMAQNPARASASYLATEEFQPGLFSFFRTWAYRLAGADREGSRPRWFSSFIGDHILLFSVGLPYIISMALLPLVYWPNWPKGVKADALHIMGFCIHAGAVILGTLLSSYLAMLLMGFLYCTLEHSATFQPRSRAAARWHLFIFMALWAPQMLVMYKVHKDLHGLHAHAHAHAHGVEVTIMTEFAENVYERLGVLPQLFVSHSMAMMGAIMLGHHEHFHRSQDLPWKETPFIAVVLLCAAGWHYMAEARGRGQEHPQTDEKEFGLAHLYIYLFLPFRVTVGITMLLLALYGRNFRSHHQGLVKSSPSQLRVSVTREQSWTPPNWDAASLRHVFTGQEHAHALQSVPSDESRGPRRSPSQPRVGVIREQSWTPPNWDAASLASCQEDVHAMRSVPSDEVIDPHQEIVLFDYDGALVLLTFCMAILFPVAMTYAMYSLALYWSMMAEILCSFVGPLGCCVFVLVAWQRPPKQTWVWAACLRTGTLLSICSAMHHGAVESCLVRKGFDGLPRTPAICCLYPGLQDFNQLVITVHEQEKIGIQRFCNDDYAKKSKTLFTLYLDRRKRPSIAFDLFETVGCIGCVELFFTLTGLFFKLTLRLPKTEHAESAIDHCIHNVGDLLATGDPLGNRGHQRPSDTHGRTQLSHRGSGAVELVPRSSDAAFAS